MLTWQISDTWFPEWRVCFPLLSLQCVMGKIVSKLNKQNAAQGGGKVIGDDFSPRNASRTQFINMEIGARPRSRRLTDLVIKLISSKQAAATAELVNGDSSCLWISMSPINFAFITASQCQRENGAAVSSLSPHPNIHTLQCSHVVRHRGVPTKGHARPPPWGPCSLSFRVS